MATRPSKSSKTETPGKQAARTRRLRNGEPGKAIVPRQGTVGGGRAIGQQNKTTAAAKQALEAAFQGLGGVPALVKWGKSNRTEFYKIWARLIPKDVQHDVGAGLEDLLAQLAAPHAGADAEPGDYIELRAEDPSQP